jgi:hypothetical protein
MIWLKLASQYPAAGKHVPSGKERKKAYYNTPNNKEHNPSLNVR